MQIDLSEHMRGVPRNSGADYLASTQKLLDQHGGLFAEDERIKLVEVGRCKAVAELAMTGFGVWLYGLDTDYAVGGRGSPVSIWDRIGYSTRSEALAAAIDDAAQYFESTAASVNSCLADGPRQDCVTAARRSERTRAAHFRGTMTAGHEPAARSTESLPRTPRRPRTGLARRYRKTNAEPGHREYR